MNEHYHFYYIKDHLGNVRETYKIPNAGTKECVQRMQYYPSGLPWAASAGASEQPWKYNSKEFVEMHGYDVYEYGARGYYATIGRFTSIDPLCEQTPWQSPYVYANNNWINNIDWMGMSADGYTTVDPQKIAKLLNFLSHGNSLDDYDFEGEGWDVMEDWTFDESEGKLNIYVNHISGEIVPGLDGYIIPDAYVMVLSYYIEDLRKEYQLDETDVTNIASLTNGILGSGIHNEFYWIGKNGKLYFRHMLQESGGYAYSNQVVSRGLYPLKFITTGIGSVLSLYSIKLEIDDIRTDKSITWANAVNIGIAGVAIVSSFVSGPVAAGFLLGVGVYSAVDLIYGRITTRSISDRIDKSIIEW